jgi:hypothetical protein
MNAYTTEPYGDSYLGSAPVLIAGDSEASLRKAALTLEAAGARIGAAVMLEQAAERIALQASASALWVEMERDGGATMDRLLAQVASDAGDGRYPVIVSAGRDLLDPIVSGVGSAPVEIVIDGDDAERAAAFAVATSVRRNNPLSDIAADRSSDRLRQLSDEVSRIASTLARLSTDPTRPLAQRQLCRRAMSPRSPRSKFGRSFGHGGCAAGSSKRTSLPIRPGICFSTSCRQRSLSSAFPYQACV